MPYTPSDDIFRNESPQEGAPARSLEAVVLSDTVDLSPYAEALKCNEAGTIYVLPVGNYLNGSETPVKLIVNAGEYVPIQVARVFSTGTSLTGDSDIIAMRAS